MFGYNIISKWLSTAKPYTYIYLSPAFFFTLYLYVLQIHHLDHCNNAVQNISPGQTNGHCINYTVYFSLVVSFCFIYDYLPGIWKCTYIEHMPNKVASNQAFSSLTKLQEVFHGFRSLQRHFLLAVCAWLSWVQFCTSCIHFMNKIISPTFMSSFSASIVVILAYIM